MADTEKQRLYQLKSNLERRAEIYYFIRGFFRELGFLEIETPIHVPVVAPEMYINPFTSERGYLGTSPELHMKRMIAAGA